MSDKIILQVPETGLYDGEQDDEGVIHYDPVKTPHGPLGNLKVKDGAIVQADSVALIKRNHPGIVTDAFGIQTLTVQADNGTALYRVLPNELEWSDRPGEEVKFQLGLLQSSDWGSQ